MAVSRRFSTPRPRHIATAGAALAALLLSPGLAAAQTAPDQTGQALAKDLANPIAAQVSLFFGNDYDWGLGLAHRGSQYTLTVQPLIPFRLNADWNLITRTTLPFVSQSKTFLGQGRESGLGDVDE